MTNEPGAPVPTGRSGERISRGERRRLHPPCEMHVSAVAEPCQRGAGALLMVREPTR
jgi:hypothetical protein